MAVVIETTIGDFTVDLYTEERPQTCRNFLKLCKLKYYNWNLFHTVQSNFIAQTGDPTGTGKGGESVYGIIMGEKARYYEGEQMPKIKHDRSGLLSMVNCGNNMLGSQFFITLAPHLQSLDGEHCVFGEITEGLEIILKFNETICDGDQRPYQDIRISHTVILEDPFEDPKGFVMPDRSPEPTREALMSDRIGADEVIDDTAGMTTEEIVEMQKEKEAKARATILEIVGDIPDAEMAPPENVLFVCKLNPVTNDDDLEIIFSRFGKIKGCEVIRDRQTGDSLQYAFIEFADRKSCEEAYFKMDNVLIDDRRIHVDFSQSVAKMRWRGKGKGIKYFDEKDDDAKKAPAHILSQEKHSSRNRKKDEGRQENTRNRDPEKGYKDNALDHRKYDRRKDESTRESFEKLGNGGKYQQEKERSKEGRQRDNSRELREYEYRRDEDRRKRYDRAEDKRGEDRRREKYRDRKKGRSRERSRDRGKDRNAEKSKNRGRDRSKDRTTPDRSKEKPEKSGKHKHKYEEKRGKDTSPSASDSENESRRNEKEQKHKKHAKRRKKDTDSSDSDYEDEGRKDHKSKKENKHKRHESRKKKDTDSSESGSEEEKQKHHRSNKDLKRRKHERKKRKDVESSESDSEDEQQKHQINGKERAHKKHKEKKRKNADSSD